MDKPIPPRGQRSTTGNQKWLMSSNATLCFELVPTNNSWTNRMQLLPLLICPQERHLLFKIPQDYKHASSCQFAVHTPRILCWTKQKQKKLIPVASRYFILRRRHSTAVADFPITIRQAKTSVQISTFPEPEPFPHGDFDRTKIQWPSLQSLSTTSSHSPHVIVRSCHVA